MILLGNLFNDFKIFIRKAQRDVTIKKGKADLYG